MGHDPIFIVGAPQSGTTLLASMIACDSSIAIGPETHFFRSTGRSTRTNPLCGRWPESAINALIPFTLEDYIDNIYRLT